MKKFIVVISIYLVFSGIVSCGKAQLTPQEPTQTKISPTVAIKSPTPTEELIAVFNLSSANKVPPEDILQEISFYGAGGGEFCWPSEKPIISYEPLDGELMTLSTMIACGWHIGEILKGSIRYPDGHVFTKEIKVEEEFGITRAFLEFKPAIDDPQGTILLCWKAQMAKLRMMYLLGHQMALAYIV